MEALMEWLSTFAAGNRNAILFGVVSFLGANFHYLQGRLRKTISDSWLEYWFISNKLNSAGALGALIGADVLFMGTNSLEGATALFVIGGAWGIGYGLDAGINKGTPGTGSVAEVAKAVDAGKIDNTGTKQGGFAKVWYLAMLAFCAVTCVFMLAACGTLGLTAPKNAGQSLTQGFGVAIAVETIIPNLLVGDVISTTNARKVNNTAHTVAGAIKTYWTTYGLFQKCQTDAVAASTNLAPDGAVAAIPDAPDCKGPDPTQVLIAVSASLAELQSFLVTYQSRAGAN